MAVLEIAVIAAIILAGAFVGQAAWEDWKSHPPAEKHSAWPDMPAQPVPDIGDPAPVRSLI